MLWIAFKFVSLYRMTQPHQGAAVLWRGCELLSNLYLCIGWHSKPVQIDDGDYVVNCFHFCIFVSDDTAQALISLMGNMLWIAFKFVSLYRMTQHELAESHRLPSCELLSNLYLCIGWHSFKDLCRLQQGVVNCFQICIFVSDDTAAGVGDVRPHQLWIAFKFVSLYRMTQPLHCVEKINTVVNCFKICIFV